MRHRLPAVILLLVTIHSAPFASPTPVVSPNGGSAPSWSPDGAHLAFLSATPNSPVNVWVMEVSDPRTARPLTRLGARFLDWSPDGAAVYCQTSRGGASAFHAIRVADGTETRILDFLGPDVSTAAWSADGTQVAWLKWHDDHRDLWAADVSGAGVRQLTEGAPLRSIVWSPDGQELACDLTAGGGTGVVTVPAAGGAEPKFVFPSYGTDPSWSPDGSRLAVVGMHALTVVNRDGAEEKRLHVSQGDRSHVDWSPDGSQIAYTSGANRLPALALIDPATDTSRDLRTGWLSASTPRWSPDGRQLAFEGKPTAQDGVTVGLLDLATGRARAVTPTQPSYWAGAWVQGGRRLLYFTDDTVGRRVGLCRRAAGSGRPQALLGVDPRAPQQVSWPAGASEGIAVLKNEIWRLPAKGPAAMLLKTEQPTWAALSPTGDRLAYVKWVERRPSVVLREVGGDTETELLPALEEGGGYSRLAWAPDGESLAYLSGPALMATDLDGDTQTLFEVPGSDQPAMLFAPVWSPDGDRIAIGFFTRNDGQKYRVLLLDTQTGATRVLAECPVVAEPGRLADPLGAAPAWSPDGARLAYTLERDGAPAVFVADVESGAGDPAPVWESAAYPTWSADGRRLLTTLLDRERERLAEIDLQTGRATEVRLSRARFLPSAETAGD